MTIRFEQLNSLVRHRTLIKADNVFLASYSREIHDLKAALFVASGTCYAGGVATSAGSGTVASFDPDTGAFKRVVVDYNRHSPILSDSSLIQ